MDSKCMEMATLGRPIYPGMLYDCRNDFSVPGVTLWDKKLLLDELIVQRQPKTDLRFTASDRVSDKAKLLDVSASIKASFLGGLIEVGGSAKYLNDSKTSENQSRITLQYNQTTKFEQVSMAALGKITYPQVFDQQTATHVVTAVLYGAQAFMLFDYTSSQNENKQEIAGQLQAVVKKIPSLSIQGEASIKMNENEKNLASNISVTFYGDYELDSNPTTYTEAMQIYKKLPTLLKSKGSDGVPMKVWLYPLKLLNDKAAKLMREISISVVSKTENLLEELSTVERRCNDLCESQGLDDFPALKDRLRMFQDYHSDYKIECQKKMFTVLPAIRGGKQDETALANILESYNMSPFVAANSHKWLDNITTEIKILRSNIRGLKNISIVTSSGSLNSILFNPDIDVVVCLAFTSLNNTDPHLDDLRGFLDSDMFASLGQTKPKVYSIQTAQPLLTSADVSKRMRQNVSLFKSFSTANKGEKKMWFIIASILDPSNQGSSIRLYEKGRLTDPKFLPVSKPAPPELDISDKGVQLKLQAPSTGKTVRFRVEYRTTQPADSGADSEGWKVTDTPNAQSPFTLTGLPLSPKYWVRYRAVSALGVSEASDSVTFSLQKKSSVVPLSQSWNWSTSTLVSDIRSKIAGPWSIARSVSTTKTEITNPSIPYVCDIAGGMKPGTVLYVQGTVSPTADSISYNFKTEPTGNDIAFHLSTRIKVRSVARDSYIKGCWENLENTFNCPLSSGSVFDIFFVTKTEGYDVYFNGQWYCLFKHRVPVEKVTTLNINGDVLINIIGIVQNWNTSSPLSDLRTKTMGAWSVSRWSHSTIVSEVTNVVNNPIIPYKSEISAGLKTGMALYFQGTVLANAQEFQLNLGPKGEDIAFHFNPRINTSLVCNSYRNGSWDAEDILGCPVTAGSAFDIFYFIKTEGYEVYVNGQRCCLFKHRVSVDKVTTLGIYGNVVMNTFGIIPNWSTSTFGKELSPGVSRNKLSKLQSDWAKPLTNPSTPYTHAFPEGLRPGIALFFQGVVVSSDFNSFIIDMEGERTKPCCDVIFHLLCYLTSVVRNTCKNNEWMTKEETMSSPFVKGGAFDIIILVKTDCYEVIVNGLTFCTYNHRIAVEKVFSMTIRGDVFVNSFAIIDMDSVNMKVSIPANI